MQRILITGANGFVGYYLTKLLLEKGYGVIASGKGECRLPFQERGLIYEPLDIANDEEVKNVIDRYQPGIVVHCGAISKPDECEVNKENAFRINVTATVNLLKAAAKFKSFFIFLSTDFVFDGEKGMYKELDERRPVNYYGQTKILAEDEVMKYRYEWAIVRTVLVYGKPLLSRQNLISHVAIALQKGERLTIFDDQVRTPTYVEDLAAGIERIIEKRKNSIYHISGEDVLTPYQMAVAVARYLGLDVTLIDRVEEKDLKQPARRPLKTGFDISKAKAELNFRPVSFDEGLRKTFA